MTKVKVKKSEPTNLELLYKMQAKGFNIVTCGHCGAVKLHLTSATELTCEDCGIKGEPCDFPDLYY